MTPRLALRIALSASLLIHLWLSWLVMWRIGGCGAGSARALSPATLVALDVLSWPVDQLRVQWVEWTFPLGAMLASFELWFLGIYLLLRIAMVAAGVRRPASVAA